MQGFKRLLLVEQPFTETGLLLALEEAMMQVAGECRLYMAMVWWDKPSVVVGRSVRLQDEVRIDEALAWGIGIFRRKSGGGAVYHDQGNLNVTVVTPKRLYPPQALRLITDIVLDALRMLGLQGHVENGSDVVVGGRKVSGSAVYITRNSTLAHATLLVEADLELARRILVARWDRVLRGEVTPAKYMPENISSFKSEVGVAEAYRALEASLARLAEPLRVEAWPGLVEAAYDLSTLYYDEAWTYEGAALKRNKPPRPGCPRV